MDKRKIVSVLIDYVVIIAFSFMSGFVLMILFSAYVGYKNAVGDMITFSVIKPLYDAFLEYSILIFCFLYYSHAFKKSGQTVGEKIMKIKIVSASGDRIPLWSGILRMLSLAPFLAIVGLIYVPKSREEITKKITVLDRICKTETVKI